MKLTYKEFCKQKFNEACKKDWFNPHGNSVTATCNRGFAKELKGQIRGLNYDVITSVNFKELGVQIINLILLVSVPVIYIPMLFARAIYKRQQSHKEMRESYEKHIKSNQNK